MSAAINAVVVLALVALYAFLVHRLIRVERALWQLLIELRAGSVAEVAGETVKSERLHLAIVEARRLVGL